jgi:hypothetical protein
MYKILLPALAVIGLSACDDFWDREGVGFTGINGEPRTITAEKGGAEYVSRRGGVPAELAGQPVIRVAAETQDLSDLAGVAIANGGRDLNTAVEVGGGDGILMLSQVEVNGILFAVLRSPVGTNGKIAGDQGAPFASSVPRLTGCLVSGDAYQAGTSKSQTSGYAVPVNCR